MDAKTRKTIEGAIRTRAKAKALEAEAKQLKAESNDILLPLMTAHELKDYTIKGLGKATVKTSKGSNVNIPKLRENMLLAGIAIEDVDQILEDSSTSWSREYVEFREER